MSNAVARQPVEPLAYTVADASRAAGIGQTKLFELIGNGKLESSKIGRKRLIPAAALKRLIAEGC